MNDKITFRKILPVGLMLFSFFFGAGNLIFPPILGQMAGDNIFSASLGFCISGAGLPLLGILAMAIRRCDNPEEMVEPMSSLYAKLVIIMCALTIGPFFAIPRTAAMSFETGMLPLLPAGTGALGLAAYSLVFFGLTYYLAINPSRIITGIGKFMSPLLLACLAILLTCAFMHPAGPLGKPDGAYAAAPFFRGFQEGYNTMDLLCSLLFGAATIQTIQLLGIREKKALTHVCIHAGIIAAVCLAVIYAALSYMGALSKALYGAVPNGAQLLTLMSIHYMGMPGQIVLTLIIIFACLTTSIGLTTSIATNFSNMTGKRVSYERFVVYITLFSLAVSNFGLNNIIKFSIPFICMLYPIVIAIVILNLGESIFYRKPIIFRCCLTLTTLFAMGDGLRAAGLMPKAADALLALYLPLFELGFGWVLPCFGGIMLGMALDKLARGE